MAVVLWRRPRRGVFRFLLRNKKAGVGGVLFLLFAVIAAVPNLIAPYSPVSQQFNPGAPASMAHLLGTTAYGQDVFSQLIWGTRFSLIVALAAGAASTALSVAIGVSAAYLGGLWDGALSLVTDTVLVIPTFPLIIVIAAYARGSSLLVLIIVLVATGWPYGARQLRSQMLSIRNREFLEAARLRGERRLYIITFEVLPTMASLIVACFLGQALYAVLAAVGLQFVGLGDANAQSWGTMLYWAQNSEALNAGMPLWAIMPGLCIGMLGASFALLNYAFDELSNPALRPARFRSQRRRRGE